MEKYDNDPNEEIPYTFEEKVYRLSQDGYTFQGEAYIREAFRIFRENPGHFLVFSALWLTVFFIFGYVVKSPVSALTGVISAPLFLGYGVATRKLQEGDTIHISDFFKPFDRFIELLIGVIAMAVMIAVGFILLVIPGIFLMVALLMTPYIIYYSGQGFWEAITGSRKVIQKKWLSVFIFVLLLGLINALGVLVFYVGLFVTMPVTGIAMYLAYQDIFERSDVEL